MKGEKGINNTDLIKFVWNQVEMDIDSREWFKRDINGLYL